MKQHESVIVQSMVTSAYVRQYNIEKEVVDHLSQWHKIGTF